LNNINFQNINLGVNTDEFTLFYPYYGDADSETVDKTGLDDYDPYDGEYLVDCTNMDGEFASICDGLENKDETGEEIGDDSGEETSDFTYLIR